jgi:hypothetical protein
MNNNAQQKQSQEQPPNQTKPCVITVHHGPYNWRRYSRPWIGRIIKWDVGKKPELEWGRFCGSDDDGGDCEIEAYSGDITRTGQRDHRKVWKSDNDWFIVGDDGEIITDRNGYYLAYTEAAARKHWREQHSTGPQRELDKRVEV